MLQDEFDTAFENCWRLMTSKGLALVDIVTKLSEFVVNLDVKQPLNLARLVASLADLEQRLSLGTSEKLQLAGLVGIFVQCRQGLVSADPM